MENKKVSFIGHLNAIFKSISTVQSRVYWVRRVQSVIMTANFSLVSDVFFLLTTEPDYGWNVKKTYYFRAHQEKRCCTGTYSFTLNLSFDVSYWFLPAVVLSGSCGIKLLTWSPPHSRKNKTHKHLDCRYWPTHCQFLTRSSSMLVWHFSRLMRLMATFSLRGIQ